MTVIACNSLKEKNFSHEGDRRLPRPHKAVTFVVERGKERQEWNEQILPKALPGYSGGRLPGKSTEEKGRDKEEEGEGSEQRQGKNEIIEGVITSSQRMALEECCKSERRRTEGQNPYEDGNARRLRLKKKRKAGKKATKWQNNGTSLTLDVIRKALELVVNERMLQGQKGEEHQSKEGSARMVY